MYDFLGSKDPSIEDQPPKGKMSGEAITQRLNGFFKRKYVDSYPREPQFPFNASSPPPMVCWSLNLCIQYCLMSLYLSRDGLWSDRLFLDRIEWPTSPLFQWNSGRREMRSEANR